MPSRREYEPRKITGPEYLENEVGCWLWQGSLLNGYGVVGTRADDSTRRAHRIYYERAKGPIPEGHDIHHLCRTPACVNPDHLEPLDRRAHKLEHLLAGKGRTFSDVLMVRADRAQGLSFRQIAAKYGLSYSTVRRWCGNGLEPAWTDFVGDTVAIPFKVCEREDCDKTFRTKRPDKRYCCSNCSGVVNGRRYRAEAREKAA